MRSCAVAQHDPPKVCKPLLAASCDSSFLYVDPPISPSSIVLRILRFLYVSLQQRHPRGHSIPMRQDRPEGRAGLLLHSYHVSTARTTCQNASTVSFRYSRFHVCPGPLVCSCSNGIHPKGRYDGTTLHPGNRRRISDGG